MLNEGRKPDGQRVLEMPSPTGSLNLMTKKTRASKADFSTEKGLDALKSWPKDSISLLQIYCQQFFDEVPCIEFWDTDRTYDKFGCVFFLHGIKIGEGTGESKSNAKRAAAEDALQELAPVIFG